ncbi:Proteasome subunit beta type-1 [Cucumispora dikerogammari]|nr:Proteasome subunit beta type-1 [Cucumispora dikerogammari]
MECNKKSSHNGFNPYEYNSGTILAFADPNSPSEYVVLASDTRLNSEYNFYSRTHSKIYKINNNFSIIGAGFDGDLSELHVILKHSILQYEQMHDKEISLNALAHKLMNILYSRRFFPYYSFVCLAGKNIDKNNEMEIVSFDCVGSYEKTKARVYGSGQEIVQPLLDALINKNTSDVIDLETVKSIVFSAFTGAAERDVKTGDYVEILVIKKDGVQIELMDLRKD